MKFALNSIQVRSASQNDFRMLFNKKHLSEKWDIFGCFQEPKFEPNELLPIDPFGTKKYSDNDEDGASGSANAAQAVAMDKLC